MCYTLFCTIWYRLVIFQFSLVFVLIFSKFFEKFRITRNYFRSLPITSACHIIRSYYTVYLDQSGSMMNRKRMKTSENYLKDTEILLEIA